jgi:4-amino-4-deoxy-L-arabinose transferase-like glycosyltransferase
LIIGVATVRVAATHRVFSATADETQHIAGGIEWLRGSFGLWREQKLSHVIGNPPLARIAVGLGPALAGVRDTRLRDLLYDGPGYEANLVAARRGILPFLALLIGLTFWLGRRLFGDAVGLVAAAAVSTVPAVLGHAGLATTDVAATSTFLLALLALLRWLERPTRGRALALGVAFGLAFVTKMSVLTMVPAALVVALVRRRAEGAPLPVSRARLAAELALAAAAAGLVAWATYRFSFGRPAALADPATLRALVDGCTRGPTARRLITAALGLPLPAPEIADGLVVLCADNGAGQSTSYLLGRITQDGFPLFFPLALAVKTPLPFLALAVWGLRTAGRDATPQRWRRLAPALVAATLLLLLISTRVNIGVRHALQLYPLLAIYVGVAAVALFRSTRVSRAAVVALGAWQLATPFIAAPDYLPWFNALAGRHPENVLLDSDLDWGQDLLRLERALAERGVRRFSVAYFGPSDLCRHHLPTGRWLRPRERVTGVIAISEMYRKGVIGNFYRDGNYCDREQWVREAPPDPGQFAWLDAYTPIARVGTSILLYDIPPDGAPIGR